MGKTHWKKVSNPNYMGSWDLDGEEKVGTIRSVKQEMVQSANGGKEECTLIQFDEFKKPLIANVTNKKAIAKALGSPYIEDWIGKRVQIGTDKVSAFGELVDAVRIRTKAPKELSGLVCESCGKVITPAKGMSDEEVASYTKSKYGKQLCAVCASKAKKAESGQE